MLIYSDIKPPEFVIERPADNKLVLHYYSTREGLTDFMFGLIQGLAELYNATIDISIVGDRRKGGDHDIFEINVTA